MSATTASNANYIFKHKWLALVNSAKRMHPVLDRIAKVKGLTNTTTNTVQFGNDQGAAWGDNLSTAQTNASQTKGMQFDIPVRNGYRVAQIGRVALELSKDREGAYESLIVNHLESATRGIYDDLGFMLFRDGTGARGKLSTYTSGNTLTLTVQDDCRNFHIGMTIKSGTSTSSLHTGTTTVTKVNYGASTIDVADASQLSGLATSDFLFREKETGTIVLDGFDVLNPLTAPSASETFRGSNDRTTYMELLAGYRLSATAGAGRSIEEKAMQISNDIFGLGGSADTLVLHPRQALEVVERQGGKIQYQGGGGDAVFGFTGVKLVSPAGTLEVVADPDCPVTQGRVTKLSDWVIMYAGPKFIHSAYSDDAGGDGDFFKWMASSDAIEGRWSVIANMYCKEPKNHGVFELAAP